MTCEQRGSCFSVTHMGYSGTPAIQLLVACVFHLKCRVLIKPTGLRTQCSKKRDSFTCYLHVTIEIALSIIN